MPDGIPLLYWLAGALASTWTAVRYWRRRRENITRSHLATFSPLREIGAFKESLPLFFPGTVRQNHAVLLLHGYSASTEEFQLLSDCLRRQQTPHFAPMLTGFGLTDLHLLYPVQASDWLRDAVNAFDLLAGLANTISVVGHSHGGTLALLLAQHRPVHHLILTGPNIVSSKSDRRYKKLLGTPLISHCVSSLLPMVLKPRRRGRQRNTDTLHQQSARRCFHYPAVPTASLRVLWEMQDMIDIAQAEFHRLTLMYGEKDQTIDIPAIKAYFQQRYIPHQTFVWPNSAHNILEEHDREEVARTITEILASDHPET
ncbi:MAG: hypothetical protein BWK76_23880 [Desulfobulbaceae bacterium A2]|nr:MAG: hypothetical protein BWK76_23880 [Desulfobulbaceae bacterium A2]